jgi:hypothetical protein
MSSIGKVNEAFDRLETEWERFDKSRRTLDSSSAGESEQRGFKQACDNLKERAKNLSEEARRLGESIKV